MSLIHKCDLCGAQSEVKNFTSPLTIGPGKLADLCTACGSQLRMGINKQVAEVRMAQEQAQVIAAQQEPAQEPAQEPGPVTEPEIPEQSAGGQDDTQGPAQ